MPPKMTKSGQARANAVALRSRWRQPGRSTSLAIIKTLCLGLSNRAATQVGVYQNAAIQSSLAGLCPWTLTLATVMDYKPRHARAFQPVVRLAGQDRRRPSRGAALPRAVAARRERRAHRSLPSRLVVVGGAPLGAGPAAEDSARGRTAA